VISSEAELESTLARANVHCLASGTVNNQTKYYFYAQARSELSLLPSFPVLGRCDRGLTTVDVVAVMMVVRLFVAACLFSCFHCSDVETASENVLCRGVCGGVGRAASQLQEH
jgi:hypothetical protein